MPEKSSITPPLPPTAIWTFTSFDNLANRLLLVFGKQMRHAVASGELRNRAQERRCVARGMVA